MSLPAPAAACPESLGSLRRMLRSHLLDFVLPFWQRHAVDPAGGINSCIADDGTVLSRDKWLWSQWRAVWVYSALYNRIERRAEWLDLAEGVARFAARGWDTRAEGWALVLDAEGKVIRGCESVYTDAFAIYGLTQLAQATGQAQWLDLACKSARAVLKRLQQPEIPHFPYPIPPGAKVHGIPMIFSLVLWELGQLTEDRELLDRARTMSDEIFGDFYKPSRGLLLERVASDGSEYPPPLGSVVVPGHVVEDMWFQIHIARDVGDGERIAQAVELIRRHVEAGWDSQHGGLLLAIDADGRSEVAWDFADAKLWWPHTEAMYALLLAYEHGGGDWALQWYRRVHEYAFSHYPVGGHGEWRQKLDRRGEPFARTVALPVKDPFHLPRSLIYCLDVLGRLA